MNLYVSPHDAAIAAERRCPHCGGTGRRLDFTVSGMRVVVPCSCPLGESETTLCEIGNPRARKIHDPSQHRRASNVIGRPKTTAAYWSRVRPIDEVLGGLEC
jgi:hypothetical protein